MFGQLVLVRKHFNAFRAIKLGVIHFYVQNMRGIMNDLAGGDIQDKFTT